MNVWELKNLQNKHTPERLKFMDEVYAMYLKGEVINIEPDDPRTYEYLGLSHSEASTLAYYMNDDPSDVFGAEEIDTNNQHLFPEPLSKPF